MKPKPMTFTPDSVLKIMADPPLKTQSRRIMRVQPKYCQLLRDGRLECSEDGGFDQDVTYIKPPHQPGDIVYVAERVGYLWLENGYALSEGPIPTEKESKDFQVIYETGMSDFEESLTPRHPGRVWSSRDF